MEASTAAIEKQSRLLEAQKLALQQILQRKTGDQRADQKAHPRSAQLTRDKAKLELETSELSHSIQTGLQDAMKLTETSVESVQSSVDRILEKDDRFLDGLEKVLPQLSTSSGASGNLDDVDRLCQALVVQSNSDIYSLMDSAYSTTVQPMQTTMNGHNGHAQSQELLRQRDELRSQLEELSREIDSLSTMAVDSSFRVPITRALQLSRDDSEVEKAEWSQYLNTALRYLSSRLATMDRHFEDLHARKGALRTVSAAFESVAAESVEKESRPTIGPRSPSKGSQKGLKPLRLVQANLSESQDPTTQLLRQLDVRLPESAEGGKMKGLLPAAVKERREKVSSLRAASERGVVDQIATALSKTNEDVQGVLGAVYSNSEFGTINFANVSSQRDIDSLEQETQRLGSTMRELDVEKTGAELRAKQEALVKQFGI